MLLATIEEKQKLIFNENSPKKEVERANIQLERLMAEYDQYLFLLDPPGVCLSFFLLPPISLSCPSSLFLSLLLSFSSSLLLPPLSPSPPSLPHGKLIL